MPTLALRRVAAGPADGEHLAAAEPPAAPLPEGGRQDRAADRGSPPICEASASGGSAQPAPWELGSIESPVATLVRLSFVWRKSPLRYESLLGSNPCIPFTHLGRLGTPRFGSQDSGPLDFVQGTGRSGRPRFHRQRPQEGQGLGAGGCKPRSVDASMREGVE